MTHHKDWLVCACCALVAQRGPNSYCRRCGCGSASIHESQDDADEMAYSIRDRAERFGYAPPAVQSTLGLVS